VIRLIEWYYNQEYAKVFNIKRIKSMLYIL